MGIVGTYSNKRSIGSVTRLTLPLKGRGPRRCYRRVSFWAVQGVVAGGVLFETVEIRVREPERGTLNYTRPRYARLSLANVFVSLLDKPIRVTRLALQTDSL